MTPSCKLARGVSSPSRCFLRSVFGSTREGTRHTELEATIDQSDIRGLVTALQGFVAGLPLSEIEDHHDGCHTKLSRIPLIVSGAAFRLEYCEPVSDAFADLSNYMGAWRARSQMKPVSSRAIATQARF
jgi:hypothetical protein